MKATIINIYNMGLYSDILNALIPIIFLFKWNPTHVKPSPIGLSMTWEVKHKGTKVNKRRFFIYNKEICDGILKSNDSCYLKRVTTGNKMFWWLLRAD